MKKPILLLIIILFAVSPAVANMKPADLKTNIPSESTPEGWFRGVETKVVVPSTQPSFGKVELIKESPMGARGKSRTSPLDNHYKNKDKR